MQWHSWREDDMEPSDTGIWVRRSEVEAALAAKDAEIERLTALINDHNVAVHAKCQANELEHCRSYTSRGRLCPSCPQEWLISGVLDAIDAHQEPKP